MASAAASENPASSLRLPHDIQDATEDELITGEAVALDLRPTGFVLRAAGTIIDWLTYLGGYVLIVLFVFPVVVGALNLDEAAAGAAAIVTLVLIIVVVPTAVELLSHGKSLGKLAVGARIVRDDGGAIGFRHAFIRAMTAILEIYGSFGGLAALVALLNGRSKRLGDLIAGTYSQYERLSREIVPVYGVPVPLQEWARTADVARMPDRVARRVSSFLRQAGGLNPTSRDRLARALASEASVWVSPIPVADAELFLAAITAIRRDRELAALTLERERLDALDGTLGGLPHRFPDRS